MPGNVKAFWEDLTDTMPNQTGKTFSYMVQMGFPEASQANMLVAYLHWFSKHLGATHGGVLVRGGVEGIQIQPHWMKKKVFAYLKTAGYNLGHDNGFDAELLRKIATPYRLNWWVRMFLTLLKYFGLVNFYWTQQLKRNQVFSKRFDTPYLP